MKIFHKIKFKHQKSKKKYDRLTPFYYYTYFKNVSVLEAHKIAQNLLMENKSAKNSELHKKAILNALNIKYLTHLS